MKLSSIRRNVEKQEQGDWVSPGGLVGDLRVKVRGIDNSDYRRLRSQLHEAVPPTERINGLSQEQSEEIATKLLVETILLDWEGILDDDGNQVPYSKELAQVLLSDPEWTDFRDAVFAAAQQVFRTGERSVADVLGNSSRGSAGS